MRLPSIANLREISSSKSAYTRVMTSRRRNTAPSAPFAISDEWRAAFETQYTRELLQKAERFAKRRARKLSTVGVVVDDHYARHLVQDVLGDTATGLLRWDPGEPLEDHVMDAIATRVHHEVARARRFPHVSLDDDDPAVSAAILAAADISLLAAREASPATVKLADNALHELWGFAEADPEVRRLLGAHASGATRQADVQHATGMSAQDYHAARNRLDRLIGRLSRDAQPSRPRRKRAAGALPRPRRVVAATLPRMAAPAGPMPRGRTPVANEPTEPAIARGR
jgi:hypothetical protein